MTYPRRNSAQEIEEAYKKAQQLIAICQELHIALDPIDWQTFGMQASVAVSRIEISDLSSLSRQNSDSILRIVRIKLFERAARDTLCAQHPPRALIWSPVDVIQPQPFLSLWIITMETDERIPIAEYLRNEQRIYEPYALNMHDEQQLMALFGPLQTGEYDLGAIVTIKEREQQHTGEIIYILGPGKIVTNRKYSLRGYHSIAGKAYTNDLSSRYLVDCHDGFPHLVNQSQVIS